jgi:predicted RNA binding protein YcfA (HicA-like mRNA interferase family)
VCAIRAQHSFTEVSRRESHIVIQRKDGGDTTTIPVPDYPEMSRGTLQANIRRSGLACALFEE